jgi:fermentation-respiration switch protein FrsA (DUF1100 family)
LASIAVGGPVKMMWDQVHPGRIALTDDPGRHGLTYEDISFRSPGDGTVLRGWYMPATPGSGRAVVIAPGSAQNRLAGDVALGLAPSLVAAGFDVLTFDFRAEGESGGDTLTYGAREQDDVLGAVAGARAHGDRRVAVIGFSLGAVSAILAAARSADIEAVVADSSFADLRATLERHLESAAHLPAPLVAYGLFLYASLTGTDPARVSPMAVVAGIAPRPLLFIDGMADDVVAPSDSEALWAAAGSTAEHWDVTGAGHVMSYDTGPTAYTARVLDFLVAALPG